MEPAGGKKEFALVRYPHLFLTGWPFVIVPDESFHCFMADREVFQHDVEILVRNLGRRPGASMHLVWSWLGSGKTHAFHYIAYLCRTQHPALHPVYTEFPRGAKGFLDLYASFASGIDVDLLANACFELKDLTTRGRLQKELQFVFPDLWNALKMFYIGEEEDKATVSRWFRAEPEDLRSLKERGINRRIDRVEDALNVMTWISKLLSSKADEDGHIFRIIWMLDEYQRIEKLRTPARDEINGSLQSAFNRSPKSLSIMLSFSGKPEKKLPDWLSPELADRIGTEKTLMLPPLSEQEAFVFVRDLLHHFRAPSAALPNPLFPFTEQSIRHTIKFIKRMTELRPRRVMEGFSSVLQEAEVQIEAGQLEIIDEKFAETQLKAINFAGVGADE